MRIVLNYEMEAAWQMNCEEKLTRTIENCCKFYLTGSIERLEIACLSTKAERPRLSRPTTEKTTKNVPKIEVCL